jgi:hypothetical protein
MPFTNYRSQKTQYRQAERLFAKFNCNLGGANATFLRGPTPGVSSGSNQVSNTKVTIGTFATAFSGVTPGANSFVIAMPKTRLVTLCSAIYYPAAGGALVTDQRTLYPATDLPVVSGGNNTWQFLMLSNAGVLATPATNSTLSFVWEIAQ